MADKNLITEDRAEAAVRYARDSGAGWNTQGVRVAAELGARQAIAYLLQMTDLHDPALAGRPLISWEPEFDAMALEQEHLVLDFCEEIAGRRGEPGSPPDPVRLLEMAQALYRAERDFVLVKGGEIDG